MGPSASDTGGMMEELAQTRFVCPKCGEAFTFEDGLLCAKKYGIRDTVLMCGKCHSVFSGDGVLSSKELTIDLTDKYTALIQSNPLDSDSNPQAALTSTSPAVTPGLASPEKKRPNIIVIALIAIIAIICLLSVLGPTLGRLFNP